MSKEKRRVPKLRFPGFTEDWEQRKFKDLFIERREKTIRENEETLLSCAITGIYLNAELFSHFRGSSTIGYLKIKKYDLILSAQNLHLGNANINLSFDKGMISPAYKVFELNSIDPYFINAWVKKDSTKNFFLKATTEGASQCRKNIEWDVLLNQEIPVPNKLEQRTIGRFINNIDMIITLHQRKLEHLNLKKKALLQKLFPKNGERYPELRFPGFTDAWEQRKLEDVCNVYDGTHQTPRYTNSGVMFVSVENIETLESNKYITEEDFKSEFKVFPEYGDILLTRIGDVGSANVILDEIKRAYYVSLALLKPKDINSLFLLALLSSSSVQSEIWRRTLHIAFPKKINKNEINKVIVNQPSIPEQKKIGKLFFSLDQTITLHQRKLEHLQLQKKALLQQMFV